MLMDNSLRYLSEMKKNTFDVFLKRWLDLCGQRLILFDILGDIRTIR